MFYQVTVLDLTNRISFYEGQLGRGATLRAPGSLGTMFIKQRAHARCIDSNKLKDGPKMIRLKYRKA